MSDANYALRSVTSALPEKLAQYLEAQYHIWDESLVSKRRILLDDPGTIFSDPHIEATPSYVPGKQYSNLAIPSVVADLLSIAASHPVTGVPATPYLHQAAALEAFFRDSLELVISTGTGSGKTESFLMPILGTLALERKHRPDSYLKPAMRALLLYPMNALVNDQMSRLRRLLGAEAVSSQLRRSDGYKPTFGMYTSRTPYPGLESAQRTKRDVGGWIDSFFVKYQSQKSRLEAEGKWPAKDLGQFRKTFNTSPEDSELLTRHEMHRRPPDVLVTNYSMLEYMLLRPVDSPIFTDTRNWLEHSENKLIIVLDEAHLYQGAQGTEVSLLLRRLVSRLRVSRDKVKFILTSASLASGPDAKEVVQGFAAQLTGAGNREDFCYIPGVMATPIDGCAADEKQCEAFAAIEVDALVQVDQNFKAAQAVALKFSDATGTAWRPEVTDAASLRDWMYSALTNNRVAKQLAASIMAKPTRLADVANQLFPNQGRSEVALDGLLAACAFARRAVDGRPLLPMRAHLLFRGLTGVFACLNSACPESRNGSQRQLLGRLYAQPRLRCGCGARVFELLTHRDCGAAYLRAYYRPNDPSFLWHEPSTGLSGRGQALAEVHLLIEHNRDQVGTSDRVWLQMQTGQLTDRLPNNPDEYLELRRPTSSPVTIAGRAVVTYDGKCPVCRGRWSDRTRPKIMDLTTKGEDPFAHLIAAQVRLQPPSCAVSRQTPNAGRKSLLFSDGRQKAARLARDVPRVIEQDAFRQVILLAVDELNKLHREARVSDAYLYVAFVSAVSQRMLRFFDGPEAQQLADHLGTFEDATPYSGSLATALSDPWLPQSPQTFRMHLMRVLGSRFYSLYSLGLAYVRPRDSTFQSIKADLGSLGLSDLEVESLATAWIQGCLEDFALYGRDSVHRRVRELAAGYPVTQAGTKTGFTADQKRFLRPILDLALLENVFQKRLTDQGDTADLRLLKEGDLRIQMAVNAPWHRCSDCTYLAPLVFRERCMACGSKAVIVVPAGGDIYLRARKSFWRTPVERAIAGLEQPMTLDVQEHTAQLGYRDLGDLEATTETYERRFRDILIDQEIGIDVLSCTTTMEVGIDIGSLVAVGLSNMPPSRHNYQQRAGRSGRRGSAVSTVVTFARNNAHDAYLFENPRELIAGHPTLTGLDIDNPALVKRHAFAEMLQEFFEDTVVRRSGGNVFAALGETVPFFSGTGDGSLAALGPWLTTDVAGGETLKRIDAWLPKGCGLSAKQCKDSLLDALESLRTAAGAALPKGEDELIEFLFSHGVLPAYAFPRDLVALQIEKQDCQIIQRPQQGANIALSEYAPGRLVVIDKQTYRVGAVTADLPSTEVNRARPLFRKPNLYLQCPNCLYTADPTTGLTGTSCPVCALATVQLITVIQPEVVWPEGKRAISELDDEQTITETTVAQLPVPASDDAFEVEESFGRAARLFHGRQVPLVIMNRGEMAANGPTGFQVCEDCGFTAVNGQPFQASHERHYHVARRGQRVSSRCNGAARTVYLGYEFRTDVLLLRTQLDAPFIRDLDDAATWPPLRAAMGSLANGLALAAASELDIDPRELQCGYRLRRTASGASLAEVYIYDTLSGGAGYARLVGQRFKQVYDELKKRLAACDCDSSCTKCLRTYSNRMIHGSLDRRLALDLAAYFESNQAPSLHTPQAQDTALLPVRAFLHLNGWSVHTDEGGAASAAKSGRKLKIYSAPALFDVAAGPADWLRGIVLSDYEIAKDFPTCISRLPLS